MWVLAQGYGWRSVEKDTAVLVGDGAGKPDVHTKGLYLFLPFVHVIEARMPAYIIRGEFPVEAIDTQTPRLGRISRITVRAAYRITNFEACFNRSKGLMERIKQIEESSKLRRTDSDFWKQLLNELMEGAIDDVVRDLVWKWAEHVANDPSLKLTLRPGFKDVPDPQHDPYALSLNRQNLARKVTMELGARLQREWGITLEPLVFESIVIDPELVKAKTRSKDGEVAEAKHSSQKEAAAIRERGEAEAYVRAHHVAMLLDVLINQYKIPFNDPLVANVVRSAMYSDGQTIWSGIIDKGGTGTPGTAKTA